MVRVVVFDLDDTLYPEAQYARSGLRSVGQYMFEHYQLAEFGERGVALFDSGVRGDIFQRLLESHGLGHVSESLVPLLMDVFRNHRPELSLFPDAIHAIDMLHGRYRLAIITDGYLPPQARKIEALGLGSIFNPVIYTEAFGRAAWKPAPDAFLKVQELCGASGGDCVYVADNPVKDFTAPRVLGWRTVRVRRPGTEHYTKEAVEAALAEFELAELTNLNEVLERMSETMSNANL